MSLLARCLLYSNKSGYPASCPNTNLFIRIYSSFIHLSKTYLSPDSLAPRELAILWVHPWPCWASIVKEGGITIPRKGKNLEVSTSKSDQKGYYYCYQTSVLSLYQYHYFEDKNWFRSSFIPKTKKIKIMKIFPISHISRHSNWLFFTDHTIFLSLSIQSLTPLDPSWHKR